VNVYDWREAKEGNEFKVLAAAHEHKTSQNIASVALENSYLNVANAKERKIRGGSTIEVKEKCGAAS
jgi:hypothetical protein